MYEENCQIPSIICIIRAIRVRFFLLPSQTHHFSASRLKTLSILNSTKATSDALAGILGSAHKICEICAICVTKLQHFPPVCKPLPDEFPSPGEIETCGVNGGVSRLPNLLKTNMERHSEDLGYALQLLDGGVLLARREGIQIGTFHTYHFCQCGFTHVFFSIAFFKSIFVYLFICFYCLKSCYTKRPPRCSSQEGARYYRVGRLRAIPELCLFHPHNVSDPL